jgi:succinoglycan biosynthesis transport protein ExoP
MASPSLPKGPIPAVEFSALSLLRMVWLHKLSIVIIWLAITGITATIVSKVPPTYTAEAQILVDPQKIPERLVPSLVNTDVSDRLATISQQILSTARLQKVIDDFNLYSEERKHLINEEIINWMRKSITVKLDRSWSNNRPGAFRIGYSGRNPEVVAQVTNRIANLFIEENMRTREVQAEGTSEFIEAALQDSRKRLAEMEASISSYRVKHNGELPEQAAAVTGTLNRLQLEQASNREAIARAESSKSILDSTLGLAESTVDALAQRANAPATLPRDDSAPEAPVAAPPRPKKASEILELQLIELKARLGDAHPDVKRMVRQIAVAQENEAQQERELLDAPKVAIKAPKTAGSGAALRVTPPDPNDRPEVVQARERAQALRSQIALTEKEIVSRQADQERLNQTVTEYQNRLNIIPVREQEMAQIMRDHASLLADYESLQGKNSAAKISTDMELRQKSERFAINDPAHVPGIPTSPNRPAFEAAGSIVGLLIGCVFAFIREFRNGRLLGAWELPPSALILAHVPQIAPSNSVDGGMWSPGNWTRRLAIVSLLVLPLLGFLAFRMRLGL